MIFKRMEIKRVLQDQKEVDESSQASKIFAIIQKHQIPFSVRIDGIGHVLSSCSVIEVTPSDVKIVALKPTNVTIRSSFEDILILEADSNIDFIADETDLEGRMSRLR